MPIFFSAEHQAEEKAILNAIDNYNACMHKHSKYDKDYSKHVDVIYRKNQRTQCKKQLHESLRTLFLGAEKHKQNQ